MSSSSQTGERTFLTFFLGQELYGLHIATVREVLEYTSITKVPKAAESMRGVINVRGHAVPVIDMRKQFGLEEAERTVDTCIIIVEPEMHGQLVTTGILVDGVQEVLHIAAENVEPAPKLGSSIDSRVIQGMGKVDDRFVILLDMQEMFRHQEQLTARDAPAGFPSCSEAEMVQ
jgi:purine-binding chemotaxis protein CheW